MKRPVAMKRPAPFGWRVGEDGDLVAVPEQQAAIAEQRNQMYYEFWKENHSAAHEVGMHAMDHQHDAQQADQLATLAQQTQASDQLHQTAMAENQPSPPAS